MENSLVNDVGAEYPTLCSLQVFTHLSWRNSQLHENYLLNKDSMDPRVFYIHIALFCQEIPFIQMLKDNINVELKFPLPTYYFKKSDKFDKYLYISLYILGTLISYESL